MKRYYSAFSQGSVSYNFLCGRRWLSEPYIPSGIKYILKTGAKWTPLLTPLSNILLTRYNFINTVGVKKSIGLDALRKAVFLECNNEI